MHTTNISHPINTHFKNPHAINAYPMTTTTTTAGGYYTYKGDSRGYITTSPHSSGGGEGSVGTWSTTAGSVVKDSLTQQELDTLDKMLWNS